MTDARTLLISSWAEPKLRDGFTVITAGDGHTQALYSAVLDRYNAITGRPRPTEDDLLGLVGHKVTLIQFGENMLGGRMINAHEGTLFTSSTGSGVGILPKRARRKGFKVDPSTLLDVLPGFSTYNAQRLIGEVRSSFPALAAITQETLEQLPRQMSQTLDKCFFGTYRLPDATQSDALILAGEYWPDDDIVDRTVLLVRPEVGFSENGSMYGRQLLNGHFGEVVGYEPITFSEALSLCDIDFGDAYNRVVPGYVEVPA